MTRNKMQLFLFALILILGTSLCSAKTTESNSSNVTVFNSTNIIDSQGVKIETVFVKAYYPRVTGYTFRFEQAKIATAENEINYITRGTMLINGTTTYELPEATFSKIEMYGDYKGKYLFDANITVVDDNENNIKARRIVSLINSANTVEITFFLKNGEKITVSGGDKM